MKGIIFTEFIEMVESQLGPIAVNQMIDAAAVPNGGAYTAVGTYDPRELLAIIGCYCGQTSTTFPAALEAFGRHLFARLAAAYPMLVCRNCGTFGLMNDLDDYIHIEVRKLYPDAELPRFATRQISDDKLEVTYESPRGLADLAIGLMHGAAAHFGENIHISEIDLSAGMRRHVVFTLERSAPVV
jgi:hypothetical protein